MKVWLGHDMETVGLRDEAGSPPSPSGPGRGEHGVCLKVHFQRRPVMDRSDEVLLSKI